MVNSGSRHLTPSGVEMYCCLAAHFEQFAGLDKKERERHSKFAGSKEGTVSPNLQFVLAAVTAACTLWWAQSNPRTDTLVQPQR